MGEDIVDLLREHADDEGMLGNDLLARCLRDSADEIERLRAEVARLNTFLHPIGVVINQAVRGD